ncbi:hypothetical protein V502_09959, partial [Pseudogymnoascus sp. VKM F-4520 (FW-2644)]
PDSHPDWDAPLPPFAQAGRSACAGAVAAAQPRLVRSEASSALLTGASWVYLTMAFASLGLGTRSVYYYGNTDAMVRGGKSLCRLMSEIRAIAGPSITSPFLYCKQASDGESPTLRPWLLLRQLRQDKTLRNPDSPPPESHPSPEPLAAPSLIQKHLLLRRAGTPCLAFYCAECTRRGEDVGWAGAAGKKVRTHGMDGLDERPTEGWDVLCYANPPLCTSQPASRVARA